MMKIDVRCGDHVRLMWTGRAAANAVSYRDDGTWARVHTTQGEPGQAERFSVDGYPWITSDDISAVERGGQPLSERDAEMRWVTQ